MTTTVNPTWVSRIRAGGFETSSGKTRQWVEFYKDAKKWWKLFVKEIGAADFVIRENHFEFSGYFEVGGQGWYFNSGDVRMRGLGFLIRHANGARDFSGGHNEWVKYDDYFLFSLRNRLGVNRGQSYHLVDGVWMLDEVD